MIKISARICISDPSDSFASSPQTTWYKQPVRHRENESLHEVEFIACFLLVAVEGLIDLSVIFELSQHQL